MVDATVSQERCDFYVYILPREDDTPFYVGKGKGRRWKDHLLPSAARHNPYKTAIIRKMAAAGQPLRVIKIAEGLTEPAAFALERETIAKIGRHPKGPLTNLTDGGDGSTGLRHTEAHKAAISARMKAAMSSDEARAAQSATSKQMWASEGHREAMSAILKSVRSTPDARSATGAHSRASWEDPEVRARRIAALGAAANDPEYRALMSALQSTPEAIAAQSARALGQWSDPESRAALIAAQNAGKQLAVEARRAATTPEDIAAKAAEKRRRRRIEDRSSRGNESPDERGKRLAKLRVKAATNAAKISARGKVRRAAKIAAMTPAELAAHKAKVSIKNAKRKRGRRAAVIPDDGTKPGV